MDHGSDWYPYAVQLLGAWEQTGFLFVQMELCVASLAQVRLCIARYCDYPYPCCDHPYPQCEYPYPYCDYPYPYCDYPYPYCDYPYPYCDHPYPQCEYPYPSCDYPYLYCDYPYPYCDYPYPYCDYPYPYCDHPYPRCVASLPQVRPIALHCDIAPCDRRRRSPVSCMAWRIGTRWCRSHLRCPGPLCALHRCIVASVRRLLQRFVEPLPEASLWTCLAQIASGLAHIHSYARPIAPRRHGAAALRHSAADTIALSAPQMRCELDCAATQRAPTRQRARASCGGRRHPLHCPALQPCGARRHDLVHLDLKPSNVFIDSAARLKIGDFGCAPPSGRPKLLAPVDTPRRPQQ
jgi:hypothetical protein